MTNDTAIESGREVVIKLIDVLPYAGAVAVMLIIVFVFIIWMMAIWGRREKAQIKRDDVLIDIVRHNAGTMASHTAAINNLMLFCHSKRGDDSDEAKPT